MLAVHFFIGGVFDLNQASDFNKKLSETVCVINKTEPSGCMNVSYVAYQKAYTSNARMPSGCLPMDYMLETFNVNKEYYCWYPVNKPEEIYLDKARANKLQVSVPAIIILFCIIRFIYLFLYAKYIKPALSAPKHQTKNISNDRLQTNAVIDDTDYTLFPIPAFMLLGIVLGVGLIMHAFFSYSYQRHYTVKVCEVMDVVKINAKSAKAYVSYPVKDLVYTTTTYYTYNSKVKKGPVVCMYDSEHPHIVYLTTPRAALWEDMKEGLFSFTMPTLLLLLLIMISIFIRWYLISKAKK